MSKMQAAVGGGAIGSSINSPSRQKNSLKLKNNHRNKRKAFSVAEAMIALLIGSVALGMAAPMITKQIKQNNFTDTQFSVLRRQIEELNERITETPDGAVMFFLLSRCPDGWHPINDYVSGGAASGLNGYFPRFAGGFSPAIDDHFVCDKSDTKKECKEVISQDISNEPGTIYGDQIRNITGWGGTANVNADDSTSFGRVNGAFSYIEKQGTKVRSSDTRDWQVYFSAKNVVPTGIENRPLAVSLLGCVKGEPSKLILKKSSN